MPHRDSWKGKLVISSVLTPGRQGWAEMARAYASVKSMVRLTPDHRLVGLVVKASPSRAEDAEFESRLHRDFFRGRVIPVTQKNGTPVATLPGAWRYRLRAGTGRPGVSILWLGEMESWIYNFYLSVAARRIVWADPSLRYTYMLLGR